MIRIVEAKEGMRLRRERLKAAGMCARCGQNPAESGKTLCPTCREKNRASNEAKRHRNEKAGLCRDCGKPVGKPGQKTCDPCLEQYRSTNAARYRRYKQEGRCGLCGRPAPAGYALCTQCLAARKEAKLELKRSVFEHYGGRCQCCGESRLAFLTMDHVDGDGAVHRKVDPTAIHIVQWLVRNHLPAGFQVLCWNCNCSKAYYGACPHEAEREGAA